MSETGLEITRMEIPTVTAAELAGIAGVEANTVRKIAKELLDMLERDLRDELVRPGSSP